MIFSDALTLDAPRRTSDGFLAVRARAARTGVYDYLGAEIDPEGKHFAADERVPVYRSEAEVFAERAVRSFLMKPITDDHPREAVTAGNWRDHARGTVAKALRDGDHLAFDLLLMDAGTIAAVDAGKRELSNGYSCDLKIGDGTAPDGTAYKAAQTNIVGNHVALVKAGRAGPTCRIGDAAICDALPASLFDAKEKPVKTMLIDGLTVDISNADTAQATIATILAARDTAIGKINGLETKVAEHATTISTKDAEIETLKQQAKDAKLTPQQLRDAAASYARTVATAKHLAPKAAITDAMDEPSIKKAVVLAKLGDTAKDWTDAQFDASFTMLAGTTGGVGQSDILRDAISGQPGLVNDAAKDAADARVARLDRYANGHRGKAA